METKYLPHLNQAHQMKAICLKSVGKIMIVQRLPPTWEGSWTRDGRLGAVQCIFTRYIGCSVFGPLPVLGSFVFWTLLWVDCLSDLGIRESTWCSTAQCLLTEALLMSPETLTCHQMPCASHQDVSPYFLHPLGLASVFNCHLTMKILRIETLLFSECFLSPGPGIVHLTNQIL